MLPTQNMSFYIEHFTYNDFMVKETNLKAQH